MGEEGRCDCELGGFSLKWLHFLLIDTLFFFLPTVFQGIIFGKWPLYRPRVNKADYGASLVLLAEFSAPLLRGQRLIAGTWFYSVVL